MNKQKEEDLAKEILLYLEAEGWNCYPEAMLKYGNGRADIAATKNNILRIVEVKMSLSLALLNQANEWVLTKGVDEVYIAVPNLRSSSHLVEEILRWKKIGKIIVYSGQRHFKSSNIELRGGGQLEVMAKRKEAMLASLHEDMKNYKPGTQSGYSTPYNRTIASIQQAIAEKGPLTMKEIIKLGHHYSTDASAKSCLSQALDVFEKDKFIVDKSNKIFVYSLKPVPIIS